MEPIGATEPEESSYHMSDKPHRPLLLGIGGQPEGRRSAGLGDKCFLCGQQIGETDPRGFYTGTNNNAMMLAHRGCLNTFEANGNAWPEAKEPRSRPMSRSRSHDRNRSRLSPENRSASVLSMICRTLSSNADLSRAGYGWLGDRALRE